MSETLIIGLSSNLGGIEVFIKNYALAISNKENISFAVWEDNICFEQQLKEQGFKIYKLNYLRNSNPLKHYNEIYKFIKQNPQIDLIHLNLQSASCISFLIIAKLLGRKVIVHSHSSNLTGGKLTKLLHNINKYHIRIWADYFLACSLDAGKWMFGKKIIKSKKFEILHNGIDVDSFRYNPDIRNAYRQELNLNDSFVLINVGRLCKIKNQSFLIDIFEQVKLVKPNSKLLIVGEGDDKNMLIDKASKKNLTNDILFLGARNDINNLMNTADVLVMPSLYEGLGIVLIEAQTSGLLCVSSSAIPQEAKLTNNYYSISLDNSPESWAKLICDNYKITREDCSQIIKDNGYNLDGECLLNVFRKVKNKQR